MTNRYFYNTILPKLSAGGIIIKGKSLFEEIIESWHKNPRSVLIALLLLWMILVIMAVAEEIVIVFITGIIALMLFIGGILLVFSIKPRGYKSAAWMTVIAFFLLWNSTESIIASRISFLNATGILELTAIAFALVGWFEKNHAKKYMYATLAFLYITATILSH